MMQFEIFGVSISNSFGNGLKQNYSNAAEPHVYETPFAWLSVNGLTNGLELY